MSISSAKTDSTRRNSEEKDEGKLITPKEVKKERLRSLDAFRGCVMIGIIITHFYSSISSHLQVEYLIDDFCELRRRWILVFQPCRMEWPLHHRFDIPMVNPYTLPHKTFRYFFLKVHFHNGDLAWSRNQFPCEKGSGSC